MTYYCVLRTETGRLVYLGASQDESDRLNAADTVKGQGETREAAHEAAERMRNSRLCRCAQGCCE